MQFMYILKPVRQEPAPRGSVKVQEAILEEHKRYLEELSHRGAVLLAGSTAADESAVYGVCVFEAATESVARDMMNKDPAVWRGIMTGELFPFRVAVRGNEH